MSDSIQFFTNPQSRGRIARWMLEEVGVPYRTEVVDYGPPMKSVDYLALNPMGKVPMIRHDGQTVTEVAAICAYLAEAFPDAGLGPQRDERGAYYRWMFFAAGPLEAAVTNRALGVEVPPDKTGFVGYGDFSRVMDTLERAVSATPYITGARFTAADVYLGAHVGWGLRFGSIEARPAFAAYWERLATRPAYGRASAMDDVLVAAKENTQ